MIGDIIIRKINSLDIESINNLYYTFWNENSNINKMKKLLNNKCNNEDYIILCAVENDKVVGSIMGIVCYELYGNCDPFLIMEDLVVDPNRRNKGIGKLLLKELERIAINLGCIQIQFITERNRTDAIKFYESVGYSSKSHIGFKKKLF